MASRAAVNFKISKFRRRLDAREIAKYRGADWYLVAAAARQIQRLKYDDGVRLMIALSHALSRFLFAMFMRKISSRDLRSAVFNFNPPPWNLIARSV